MSDPHRPARTVDWVDRAAMAASLLCLVHCLAVPVLIALLPSLLAGVYVPEQIHIAILLFAAPSAAFALTSGWRRHHRWLPPVLGAIGIFCIALGAIPLADAPAELPVTVSGSLLLIAAHLRNWQLRHRH